MAKAYDRVGIAALGLALHGALFLRQPILAEARQFLFERGGLGTLSARSLLRGLFEPTGYNSRFVSMLSFRLMFDAFGYVPELINFVQVGLIALCAVLALEYVAAVTGSRATGRLVAVLWLLSAGTANALTWQATNHEKLALVFSLSCLLVVGTVRSASLRGALWLGALATLLATLALNSKEIAFFLAPVLVVQGVLFAGARAILPGAFVAAFAAVYLLRLTPGWTAYAFGASPMAGLLPYAAALVGFVRNDFAKLRLGAGGFRVVVAMLLVAAFVAACVTHVVLARRHRAVRSRALAMLGVFGASSFAIVLFQDASLYCLLVPSVGFLAVAVIVVEDLAAQFRSERVLTVARAALVVLYAATFVWMLLPGHALARHLAACRHVAAAHEAMRRAVPPSSTGPFTLGLERGDARMRWLFFDPSERCVMNFALRRDGDFSHGVAVGTIPTLKHGGYLLRFDRDFRLQGIDSYPLRGSP